MNTSLNMLPFPASANLRDHALVDLVSVGKFLQLRSTFTKLSHLANIGLGQFLGSIFAPTSTTSALPASVGIVVALRAQKQVGGIDASPVIAAVKDTQARSNRAEGILPTQAMGEKSFLVTESHLTVSGAGNGSLPFPTTGGSVSSLDLDNQSAGEGLVVDNGHVNLLNRLAVPSAVPAARGLSVPTSIPKILEIPGFLPDRTSIQEVAS